MNIVHISKDDPFLDMAISKDEKWIAEHGDDGTLYSRKMSGNARRYIESKLTGVHTKDLEILEEAEYLLPSEDIMFELSRIAFGNF